MGFFFGMEEVQVTGPVRALLGQICQLQDKIWVRNEIRDL